MIQFRTERGEIIQPQPFTAAKSASPKKAADAKSKREPAAATDEAGDD